MPFRLRLFLAGSLAASAMLYAGSAAMLWLTFRPRESEPPTPPTIEANPVASPVVNVNASPPTPPTGRADGGGSTRRDWLTPEEVGEAEGRSPRTVTDWLNEGKIEGEKVGSRWRIPPDYKPP